MKMKLPKINDIITIEYDGSDANKTLVVGRVTGVQLIADDTPAIQIAGLNWIYFDSKYSWKAV
jgi:hypothetical protein